MQKNSDELPNSAAIGILMLDTIFPRIPGDVGNPDTFAFPVKYKVVKGASPQKVFVDADPHLLQPFITATNELVETGANTISTSCGFLALFHRELVHALGVPVFTSSLLQVHIAQSIIKKGQKVGIITAGLHATQKNDYPITAMRGHSVSELILSKENIGYTGIDKPSTVIALGQEGVNRRNKIFAELTPETLVLKAAGVDLPATAAEIWEIDLKAYKVKSQDWSLAAIVQLARTYRILSVDMLSAALELRFKGKVLAQVREVVDGFAII